MANAKETPRQKMISLMYLVLIAMLALQVSSTVIFKFEQLNQNLELNNKETNQNNLHKLSKIGLEVKSKNNPGKQLEYFNKADAIRKKTTELSAFMEELKTHLIDETGGYDGQGNLKGAKEETKVEVIMLGPNKNGSGYELKTKIDAHIKWLNQQGFGEFEQIALDAEHHPVYKSKADQANKDFADLNFSNAPLVATLATISELENNILGMERVILGAIADSINIQEYKVNTLIPMVKTNSNYVVAGKTYEADLFLTAQLATESPTMVMGENNLEVDSRGVGNVKFRVSAGNFGSDGTVSKTWKAKIKVKKPNGQDTLYVVEQEYVVAKPTLQFQAAAIPSLYYNCGNKMNLSVPELGLEFNPSYQITGGVIERGVTRGSMTILPSGRTVKVKVNSDGTYIGEKMFNVKKVPNPRVQINKGSGALNIRTGVTTSDLRALNFKITPDPAFAEFLPDDAKYRITKWEATLAKGSQRKGQPITRSGSSLRELYAKFRGVAQPGYRIIVEIKEMKRLNYKGQTEVVRLPQSERFFTVPIS